MRLTIKHKYVKLLLGFTAPLFICLASCVGLTAQPVYAACPPGDSTSISHGTLCSFDGSVTCNGGYTPVYNGSTMECEVQPAKSFKTDKPSNAQYYCGSGSHKVYTSINFGCRHKGSATMDALFAIIRFLSTGVGLVLVASMIFAGIQYTSSRGDPQATAAAENRIKSNIMALLIFIFAYALLNYVIPGAIF